MEWAAQHMEVVYIVGIVAVVIAADAWARAVAGK